MAEKWSYTARDRAIENKDDSLLFLLKLRHCEAKNSIVCRKRNDVWDLSQGTGHLAGSDTSSSLIHAPKKI